jgi:DNA polymerase (family 10)
VPADLVDAEAIRGDLHCHSTWSDGRATVREVAEAALARGYDYVAICDHTPSVGAVPGLDADGVRRQAAEIAQVNEALAPFRVLRGIECDILPDGSLDLPDDVLAELDWVQISLHAGQRAPRRELTARVTHAMRHPAARCLSHPTGRIVGHRPENALDLERTIEVALESGVALEVNGLPSRLDLSGAHVREALAAGVDIVCSSDSHSAAGLANMRFAVHVARRGGAPRSAVVNALPLASFLKRR